MSSIQKAIKRYRPISRRCFRMYGLTFLQRIRLIMIGQMTTLTSNSSQSTRLTISVKSWLTHRTAIQWKPANLIVKERRTQTYLLNKWTTLKKHHLSKNRLTISVKSWLTHRTAILWKPANLIVKKRKTHTYLLNKWMTLKKHHLSQPRLRIKMPYSRRKREKDEQRMR